MYMLKFSINGIQKDHNSLATFWMETNFRKETALFPFIRSNKMELIGNNTCTRRNIRTSLMNVVEKIQCCGDKI